MSVKSDMDRSYRAPFADTLFGVMRLVQCNLSEYKQNAFTFLFTYQHDAMVKRNNSICSQLCFLVIVAA